MADIINLNQTRKANARKDKQKQAAENRRKFGQTKGEKLTEKQKKEKLERHLKGHEREKEEEE